MRNAVAGKDDERALRTKAPAEQRLSERPRLRPRLGISHAAPVSLRVALDEEETLGRALRPEIEPLRDLRVIGFERQGRTRTDRAIGTRRDQHVERTEIELTQRRGSRHGSSFRLTLHGSPRGRIGTPDAGRAAGSAKAAPVIEEEVATLQTWPYGRAAAGQAGAADWGVAKR